MKARGTSQKGSHRCCSYAFESYCATDDPFRPQGTTQDECWSGDVNTNVQWAAVVKTALGEIPIILGGEVDCVANNAGLAQGLAPKDFVELKTNMVLQGERDEMRFERSDSSKTHDDAKMLKIQADTRCLNTMYKVVGRYTTYARIP